MSSETPNSSTSSATSTVIGPRSRPSPGPTCQHHGTTRAEYRCTKCGTLLCIDCARHRDFGTATLRICACDGACESLEDQHAAANRAPFRKALVGALRYPARPVTVVAIVATALAYALLHAAAMVIGPMIATAMAIVVSVLGGGYLIEFAIDIVLASLDGKDETPAWPDFHDAWTSAVEPFLFVFAIGVVSATPAALAMLGTGGSFIAATPFAFAGLGIFLLACASLALGDGLGALKPSSIWRLADGSFRPLLDLTAGAFALLLVARIVNRLLDALSEYVPILPTALSTLVCVYATVVIARMLGLYVRERAWIEIENAARSK